MLIGELSKRSGLSKDGVRHYESLGIISSKQRQAGSRSYRDYDETALNRIEKARQAQMFGLSLKEIVPLVKAHMDSDMTPAESVLFLNERLVAIRSKIDALQNIETYIVEKLATYER